MQKYTQICFFLCMIVIAVHTWNQLKYCDKVDGSTDPKIVQRCEIYWNNF